MINTFQEIFRSKNQSDRLGQLESRLAERGFDTRESAVVRQLILETGDAALVDHIYFSPGVLTSISKRLDCGCRIYTETLTSTLNVDYPICKKTGATLLCLTTEAGLRSETRSAEIQKVPEALHKLRFRFDHSIMTIGSSAAVLRDLLRAIQSGSCRPAVIIGLPVSLGEEAKIKDQLIDSDIPCITVRGSRGGIDLSVSILNAVLAEAAGENGMLL